MSEFSKVTGYKINRQKSVAFLHNNNELSERESKEMKALCSENYKTLKKEIEDDTKKWKDIPCSWV